MNNTREIGRRYEIFAAAYLEKRGYQIIERNFCCWQGEIDLIAREGMTLVFIEVKYRRNQKNGAPEEAVNKKKQQKIRQAARYYLYRKGYPEETCCRFDVVSIAGDKVSLMQNAF